MTKTLHEVCEDIFVLFWLLVDPGTQAKVLTNELEIHFSAH